MTDYLAVALSDMGGDGQAKRGDRYLNAGAIAADGPRCYECQAIRQRPFCVCPSASWGSQTSGVSLA